MFQRCGRWSKLIPTIQTELIPNPTIEGKWWTESLDSAMTQFLGLYSEIPHQHLKIQMKYKFWRIHPKGCWGNAYRSGQVWLLHACPSQSHARRLKVRQPAMECCWYPAAGLCASFLLPFYKLGTATFRCHLKPHKDKWLSRGLKTDLPDCRTGVLWDQASLFYSEQHRLME